jgi:hypothetical protein
MLVIIVILIGLIKNKKKLIYIAIGLLYIMSTPVFFNNFFKLVEGSEYGKPISTIDCADAIVVLSGMLGINEIGYLTYIKWGDPDRFFGGMALFKAGKPQKLIFTGGKIPWDKAKKTEKNFKRICYFKWHLFRKNIGYKRCGKYCRRGRGSKTINKP